MSAVEEAVSTSAHRAFLNKRLMSLLGIVPLGTYVVLHLWTNLSSLDGPQAYDQALARAATTPPSSSWSCCSVWRSSSTPSWASASSWTGAPGPMSARSFGGLKFLLQRLAGLGVGLFIGAHVIRARILRRSAPGHETWHGMHEALSEPVTLAVYVLGMLGISYHLANGLWTACITWGLTVTPQSQRRARWLSAVVLVVLLLMSGLSLYGFLQPAGVMPA